MFVTGPFKLRYRLTAPFCVVAAWRSLPVVLLVSIIALPSAVSAQADEASPTKPAKKRNDRVWLLSTRESFSGDCGDNCSLTDVSVFRVEKNETTKSVAIEQLVQSFSVDRPLLFYVHGNRITRQQAFSRGLLFQKIVGQNDKPPFDLVIWSWPSQQLRRPLIDVREKAARTEREACLLSRLLHKVDHRVRLHLTGYSFGARIITGALHRLDVKEKKPKRQVKVALMAAAVDHGWLEPKAPYSRAMDQLQSMLLFVNSCDPALKRFRFISGSGHALGFVGLPTNTELGERKKRVKTEYVDTLVGRTHSLLKYLHSPSIADAIRNHVWGESTE